jgi:hypothetical protein
MSSDERASTTYVKEHFSHPLRVAEIGVLNGDNALNLLSMNLDRIFLIDPYAEYDRRAQEELDAAMLLALTRIVSHPMSRKASFVRMKSVEASALFPDGYFDYVYIDGDHSLKAVLDDLAAWWPKVKPGGAFAGHDYSSSIGVMRAVDNFCKANGLKARTWLPPRTENGPAHLADWLIVKSD